MQWNHFFVISMIVFMRSFRCGVISRSPGPHTMLRKWRFSLNKTTIGRCVELMSSIATHVCIHALHRSQKMHNCFLFIVNKRSYVKMLCVQTIFKFHHNAHRSCRQHCMGYGGSWKIQFPRFRRQFLWFNQSHKKRFRFVLICCQRYHVSCCILCICTCISKTIRYN